MFSIRLSRNIEEKLDRISAEENVPKSEIVREALEIYITELEKKKCPYKLGEDLFGRYGSNINTASAEYKERVRDKIREKNSY